jgi:hypothetical protein
MPAVVIQANGFAEEWKGIYLEVDPFFLSLLAKYFDIA